MEAEKADTTSQKQNDTPRPTNCVQVPSQVSAMFQECYQSLDGFLVFLFWPVKGQKGDDNNFQFQPTDNSLAGHFIHGYD